MKRCSCRWSAPRAIASSASSACSKRRGLRLILDVGSTAPLYAGCSSKVLLAYLDKEAIDSVLKGRLRPLASHTTTDPTQIRAQLAEIRRNGFAVSFEETDEGVAGVSVPIRDARDHVVASLTISGPLTRVNAATMDHYRRSCATARAAFPPSWGINRHDRRRAKRSTPLTALQ